MIGVNRLHNLLNQLNYVIEKNIDGAIVECGVWKGGAICMTKAYLKSKNIQKNVYAFDSFEGLPTPTATDFIIGSGILASDVCGVPSDPNNNCIVDIQTFYDTMNAFSLNKEEIVIKKGWFENTTKDFPEAISLLRFDGDWYSSTKDVLENLFDKVVQGGVLIFDDYGYWNGNKKAVDEFLELRNLHYTFHFTDNGEMWFIKL